MLFVAPAGNYLHLKWVERFHQLLIRVQIFITVQHCFYLLQRLNPEGGKQEADGKVLIIPAISPLKDDEIISLHHTHSQYLRSRVRLFVNSRIESASEASA